MSEVKKRLGLALSGGGYRAAAFHLGTLKKLNELGVLQKVDVLSTISGGSITGAAWCLYDGDYNSFHEEMKQALENRNVIRRLLCSWILIRTVLFILLMVGGAVYLSFTNYSWAVFPLLLIFFFVLFLFQYKLFPVSQAIEKIYNRFFYQKKTLSDLKDHPRLAIGSSNLHTGRPFTFSKVKMSDSSYVYRDEYDPPINFKHEKFPVARAVMASSCVPFAFSPVRIDKEFYVKQEDYGRIRPVLVDGGVYDNQGIQKLTQPNSSYACDIIITSDAGGNFIKDKKYPNAIALLIRTVDLFMYRIKAVQMIQHIYRNAAGAAKPIAYYSLGWRLEKFIPGFVNALIERQLIPEVIKAHDLPQEWVDQPKKYVPQITDYMERKVGYEKILKNNLSKTDWEFACGTSTNLTALSKKRIDCLIRHAENLTEIQIKLYCPTLIDN